MPYNWQMAIGLGFHFSMRDAAPAPVRAHSSFPSLTEEFQGVFSQNVRFDVESIYDLNNCVNLYALSSKHDTTPGVCFGAQYMVFLWYNGCRSAAIEAVPDIFPVRSSQRL